MEPAFEGVAEGVDLEDGVGEEGRELVEGVFEGGLPEGEGVVLVGDDLGVSDLDFELFEGGVGAFDLELCLGDLEFELFALCEVDVVGDGEEGVFGLELLDLGGEGLFLEGEDFFLGVEVFDLGVEESVLGGFEEFAFGALFLEEVEGIASVLYFGLGDFEGGLGAGLCDLGFEL